MADQLNMKDNYSRYCFRAGIKISSNGIWNGENPLTHPLPLIILQVILVVLITRTVHFLLRPLKQPRIVTNFIGGIILGPYVLGRNTAFSKMVFPMSQFNLLHTVPVFGMIFYIFLYGVKMDPAVIHRSGKRPVIIAIIGLMLPLVMLSSTSSMLKEIISADMDRGPFLFFMCINVSITWFPSLAEILTELNLLNSELGRLAMSSSMFSDLLNWVCIILFASVKQLHKGYMKAVGSLAVFVGMFLFIIFVFRPWTKWVIRRTPKGGRVGEGHIMSILLCALVMAFISDFMGASYVYGPILLGLAVPPGPPLAAALVERIDPLVSEFFVPLFFIAIGRMIDLTAITYWKTWGWLPLLLFVGYILKLVGTMVPAVYYKMPVRNAFLLGLMMNFRGASEMITFFNWINAGLVDNQSYTIIMICTLAMTAITTPLVRVMYRPLGQQGTFSKRNIQNLRRHTELRILTCIHSQDTVPAIVNLLEASYATKESPICVYVLRLVELIGRATSSLIAHKKATIMGFSDNNMQPEPLINAFLNYEQYKKGHIVVQPFTAVAPYKTMHRDICSLANDKNVALILVPFRRKEAVRGGRLSEADQALRAMIPNILAHAPCSVGILIHHDNNRLFHHSSGHFVHNVGVLFWSGPDDREALAYAFRMARHTGVNLSIIRFLPSHDLRDDEERQLDDELIGELKIENSSNEHTVIEEVVVKDVHETITKIRSIKDVYDLMIVGRRQGWSVLHNDRLAEWTECPELGVISDMFASSDSEFNFPVLVVQQHS